jgi:alpha-tubulin suppressor-like RCC1 family protein
MEKMRRRIWRIPASASLCITLLLAGCGSSGNLDLSGANTGVTCNNGGASYTPISSPVTAIAAAAGVSFAIRDDGTLWAWGISSKGQLGAGTTTNSMSPLKIGEGFTAISAGFGHSLGLKNDGTLWAWGDNTYGQLGDGTTTASFTPKQIDSGSMHKYTAISAGFNFSLAIKSDGTLWTWGDNSFGQLGIGNNGINSNSCINSIINNIITTTACMAPIQVSSDTYTAISAGAAHALALKSDDTLWAWGDNSSGELGDGCPNQSGCSNSNIPELIDSGSSYAAIAAGYFYSLAVKTDGSLMAWGSNAHSNLGTGDSTATYLGPTKIGDGFSPVANALSASKFSVLGNLVVYFHSLALDNSGSLWAWGDNLFGQLGDGSTSTSYKPESILGGSVFTAVSAGDDDHSLAIKSDGSLWAWGANSCGALGDGTTNTSFVPIQVSK